MTRRKKVPYVLIHSSWSDSLLIAKRTGTQKNASGDGLVCDGWVHDSSLYGGVSGIPAEWKKEDDSPISVYLCKRSSTYAIIDRWKE